MRRLQADVRLLRENMGVVAAMVRRLDHTIARLETNQALMLDELPRCTVSPTVDRRPGIPLDPRVAPPYIPALRGWR